MRSNGRTQTTAHLQFLHSHHLSEQGSFFTCHWTSQCLVSDYHSVISALPAVGHIILPSEPLTSREDRILFFRQSYGLDVSFAPHEPDQRIHWSPGFSIKGNLWQNFSTVACMEMGTDTHTHHAHTVHSLGFKKRPLNCDKQTRRGPRKESFKHCQIHSSHPSAPPGYPTEHWDSEWWLFEFLIGASQK